MESGTRPVWRMRREGPSPIKARPLYVRCGLFGYTVDSSCLDEEAFRCDVDVCMTTHQGQRIRDFQKVRSGFSACAFRNMGLRLRFRGRGAAQAAAESESKAYFVSDLCFAMRIAAEKMKSCPDCLETPEHWAQKTSPNRPH